MSYNIDKRPEYRGPHTRQKKLIIGDTSSSSKKVLSKALKYPSSTFQVYKERNSVGLSLNTLKSNQRYSSEHQILFHNSHLNSCSCKSQILTWFHK
jgi:hypothetical protein